MSRIENSNVNGGLKTRLRRILSQDIHKLIFHRKMTLGTRLKLLCGGPRRYLLGVLKPNYVKSQLAQRKGACKRCGACCQMSWRCPHLFYDDNNLAGCKVYGQGRAPWCKDFPIDQRCLNDRNSIGFEQPCGYWWPKS